VLTAAPGNAVLRRHQGRHRQWLVRRALGHEDVYKIYAESFRSEGHLRQIQDDASAD